MANKDTSVNEAIRQALQNQSPRTKVSTVAEAVGMSYHRLSNLANGKVHPSEAELDLLRRHLRLPDHWPGSPPHLEGAKGGQVVSLSGTPLASIPVMGNASAGPGLWNVDTDVTSVEVPASIAREDAVGFVIEGDSMMPMLEEYDTAVFRRVGRRVNGYIYLLKVPEDGYRVKMIAFSRGEWLLVSLNDRYPPIQAPEGTEILGVLIGYYRVRGTREMWEVDTEGIRPALA